MPQRLLRPNRIQTFSSNKNASTGGPGYRKRYGIALAIAALASALGLAAQSAPSDETRLLRFPTTNGEAIVFSHAGQLYTVPVAGGTARRLTDTPGYAVFPRFSADGRQLAFSAQYDGNTEVYLMSAEGGTPKRLTYTATLGRDDLADRMGPNNIVMAWTNTSNEVVFRSRMRSFNDFVGQLYAVTPQGDLPRQIPVPHGGFATFSPDDKKMAYNRVFREFRTWKRYRGGMADEVWVFDPETGALENVSNNDAQDIIPMWAPNGKIYYLSDRDGHLNLFSYEPKSKRTVQHTRFADFDIKFPSLGKGGIVFEQAGRIWHFDLKSEKAKMVPIVIREDFVGARGGIVNVSKYVGSVRPSPDGKRAVVVARGDVFTVPAKNGPTRNLSQTAGVHERAASWSPDGKWIAYLGDASGENEIYVRSQDGKQPPVQLTSGADTYYFTPVWSPDSKMLMWGDRAQRLRIVVVDTKEVLPVDESPFAEITQYAWSPDSQWVSWTRQERGTLSKVMLRSLAEKRTVAVTDGWYAANSPSFSDDGKFLYFASSRDFRPTYGETEWNHIYQNMERVYCVALAKDTPSPFAPKSDEVSVAGESAAEKGADGAKPKQSADKEAGSTKSAESKSGEAAEGGTTDKGKAKKGVVVKVDLDGLAERVIGLPIMPANYGPMRAVGEKVYYQRRTGGFGPDGRRTLALYNLKDQKETDLGQVDVFEISADGKKMLVKVGSDYALIDLPSSKVEVKDALSFAGLEMQLDRQAEWAQIYAECWRQMRDYLYAPNMHGVDWPAQKAKYAELLPHVHTRNDLTYLIGELIGELNVGHAYVGGGDRPEAARIQTGLLGAELSRDKASGAYRIARILKGENWQKGSRSPLTEIGVNVAEGDYIVAVNGKPTAAMDNLYASLVGTVGRQVVLRVNKTPSEEGSRDVTVVPIADEAPLYYQAWVRKNIAYVSDKTGGRVGYLHIPDMGPEGLNEFVKHFYPQLDKEALIIDVRGNGGGNVSPMIIERLRRELAMINYRRGSLPTQNPADMLLGPKVTLLNEYSASDGDLFPYRFRTHGLGKLIGKRSWGGVVGIRGSLPLTDGGTLNKPEFGPYAKDGSKWIIEGEGVVPDIVVDNDPAREFRGEDQQLDRGISEILEELRTKGQKLPPPPPWPVKAAAKSQ